MWTCQMLGANETFQGNTLFHVAQHAYKISIWFSLHSNDDKGNAKCHSQETYDISTTDKVKDTTYHIMRSYIQ